MPDQFICDFCSQPHVRWCYPARDFIDVGVVGRDQILISESVGAWAACEDCHVLIEAGEREALVRRSVVQFVALYGQALPGLEDDIRRLHQQFFAYRSGPAIRVNQTPVRGAATPPPHS